VSKSMHAEQNQPSPYNHHLQQFLTSLKQERGFADDTIVNRQRSLKPFLTWLVGQCLPLSAVSPVVITKYFTSAVAGRWKRTTVSFHVQSLRSFFRYASSRGWCAKGIAESIDAPRLYTYENLPQGPSWEEVKKLLATVNGASPRQIRSRCAILLCSVYGFRVGEVCRLRLEDIDWAEEKIFLRRPKQRKVQTYPLTTEVGNALLRYLMEVRPRCTQREVLLTLRRPYRPVSVGALSTMTQKLQKRLGLKLKRYGSHVLRHACATHLLAQGLTLKEVGDHLGHVSVAATRIYAGCPTHRALCDVWVLASTGMRRGHNQNFVARSAELLSSCLRAVEPPLDLSGSLTRPHTYSLSFCYSWSYQTSQKASKKHSFTPPRLL
jgi:integrase/recombinase XerD